MVQFWTVITGQLAATANRVSPEISVTSQRRMAFCECRDAYRNGVARLDRLDAVIGFVYDQRCGRLVSGLSTMDLKKSRGHQRTVLIVTGSQKGDDVEGDKNSHIC
jgi:hypothetical protein